MGKNVTWQLGIETETQVYVTLPESGLFLYPNHSHSFALPLLQTCSVKDAQATLDISRKSKDQLTNSSQVARSSVAAALPYLIVQ